MCSKSRGKTHLAGQGKWTVCAHREGGGSIPGHRNSHSESHSASIEFISTNQPLTLPLNPFCVLQNI